MPLYSRPRSSNPYSSHYYSSGYGSYSSPRRNLQSGLYGIGKSAATPSYGQYLSNAMTSNLGTQPTMSSSPIPSMVKPPVSPMSPVTNQPMPAQAPSIPSQEYTLPINGVGLSPPDMSGMPMKSQAPSIPSQEYNIPMPADYSGRMYAGVNPNLNYAGGNPNFNEAGNTRAPGNYIASNPQDFGNALAGTAPTTQKTGVTML